MSKGFAEDLSEGKFSFPLIHAIRRKPDDQTLMNILRQRPKDNSIKKYAIRLMDEFGSFAYTRSRLTKLDNECRKLIQQIGDNQSLLNIIDLLKSGY